MKCGVAAWWVVVGPGAGEHVVLWGLGRGVLHGETMTCDLPRVKD